MARLSCEPTTTFGDLGKQVFHPVSSFQTHTDLLRQLLSQIPATVDPTTIALSNAPTGGDSKRMADIAKFKVAQIGLKYVQPSPCAVVSNKALTIEIGMAT